MPEPVPWRQMVGPSIILAGLALGSGEFIFWPYLTYKTGFVFFWACLLGVCTQFFLNMEIVRWTLATGESAITGFCRLSRHWAWVFLILNTVPWVWPGWATGAAEVLSWMVFGPVEQMTPDGISYEARYVPFIAVAGLWLVGIVLTSGPVVYNTVERIQFWLVVTIFVIAVLLGVLVIRASAVSAMLDGVANIGTMPDPRQTGVSLMTLLGALAFAGAGGTMNLGQSNYIKDKGFGMGRYIGRITSPVTGQEEAVAEVGFHFKHTPENMRRWWAWWKAANIEHFTSFFCTCIVCLVLLALISYSLFYTDDHVWKPGAEKYGKDMDFVWGEATLLEQHFASAAVGSAMKTLFFVMGIALLVITEFGVLDATARISTDIVKVNYLRGNDRWSASKVYFCFLWGEILVGSLILVLGAVIPEFTQPGFLLMTSAAMNGGVMFLYSLLLLYMNTKILSRSLSINAWRFVAVVWSCAFFGYFTMQAFRLELLPGLARLFSSAP